MSVSYKRTTISGTYSSKKGVTLGIYTKENATPRIIHRKYRKGVPLAPPTARQLIFFGLDVDMSLLLLFSRKRKKGGLIRCKKDLCTQSLGLPAGSHKTLGISTCYTSTRNRHCRCHRKCSIGTRPKPSYSHACGKIRPLLEIPRESLVLYGV